MKWELRFGLILPCQILTLCVSVCRRILFICARKLPLLESVRMPRRQDNQRPGILSGSYRKWLSYFPLLRVTKKKKKNDWFHFLISKQFFKEKQVITFTPLCENGILNFLSQFYFGPIDFSHDSDFLHSWFIYYSLLENHVLE